MSDSAKQTSAQLLLVAGSAQKAAEASARLRDVAAETRSRFAPTVELYAKLARSTEGLGISSERLLNVTRTIGMAYKVSGASAEETANSMRQLAQGLQAGALRGDEFISVMEGAPRLAKAIADGMGVSVGQLRDLAAQGKLTSEAIINALEGQAEKIAGEFAKIPATTSEAFGAVGDAVSRFVAKLDSATGASTLVVAGINKIAGAIDFLTDHTDTALGYAKTAINAYIGAWVAGYVVITTAWAAFPEVFGDLATRAANALIEAIESAVNRIKTGVIELYRMLNPLAALADSIGNDTLSKVLGTGLVAGKINFGRLTNTEIGAAEKAIADIGEALRQAFQTDWVGEIAKKFGLVGDAAGDAVQPIEETKRAITQSAEAAAELKRQLDAFKGRANNLLEQFFPGEAARREAHELMGLLDQFGGQLDDMQRKAVEMRIDEMFTAAALGMRDLGNETGHASGKIDEITKEAEHLKDALTDAAGASLTEMFAGTDDLTAFLDEMEKDQ